MKLMISERLTTQLERIAETKGISIEESAILVLENYSDRYLSLINKAARAATKATN